MATFTFPIVLLEGTPRARGRQHGERFRDEIAAALATLRQEHSPAAFASARGKAETAWPMILSRAPDIADELQGIAEGSATQLMEILLRVGFEFFDTPSPTGCTALAFKGPRGAILGQNWDAPPEAAKELALFIHVGPQGFEQAVIASVGGLAWVGCNRHGLVLLNNDLMLGSRAPGLPSQVVRRIVLRESSVEAALMPMRSLPHMAGRSYLLGDSTGDVAGIEVSAGRGVRVNQRTAPVLHTNHALDPDIRDDEDEAALMKTYPSSRHRLQVLQRYAPGVSSVDHLAADPQPPTAHYLRTGVSQMRSCRQFLISRCDRDAAGGL